MLDHPPENGQAALHQDRPLSTNNASRCSVSRCGPATHTISVSVFFALSQPIANCDGDADPVSLPLSDSNIKPNNHTQHERDPGADRVAVTVVDPARNSIPDYDGKPLTNTLTHVDSVTVVDSVCNADPVRVCDADGQLHRNTQPVWNTLPITDRLAVRVVALARQRRRQERRLQSETIGRT